MRFAPFLASLAVVAAIVTGGTLECEPPAQTAALNHGQRVYTLMCAVCHGPNREGYKADQAPALGNQAFLASATPEFLSAAITGGRATTTMSAWGVERGGPLGKADVAELVAFLRSWQEVPSARLDEGALRGDAARGADAYARECARCHGAMGTGGTYEGIGGVQLLASASDGFLRYAIREGRTGTAMPGFRATLGDAAIDDVIALLRKWQAATPPLVKRQPPGRPPPLPLGPVPLNPRGPEPVGFKATPGFTSADVIKAQLDRGAKMAILDARAPSDYANQHISGAVSVPFYDPEPYVAQLPRDAWIVCYCGCPHAESGQLAAKLVAKGFTKVAVLDEGLGFWGRKKYPTTQGVLP